jgi:hypothetical protein
LPHAHNWNFAQQPDKEVFYFEDDDDSSPVVVGTTQGLVDAITLEINAGDTLTVNHHYAFQQTHRSEETSSLSHDEEHSAVNASSSLDRQGLPFIALASTNVLQHLPLYQPIHW